MVQNIEIDTFFAIKEHFINSLCDRQDTRVVYSRPVSKQVEGSLKDFISEARRLQKVGVSHPNIVRVNEVFEANNTAYYIMEYLEGESLQRFVRANGGPLSEEQTRRIMLPIIEAVGALHKAHLTHLDIKPDNIMITRRKDGSLRPVLIDFGLAKHYDVDGAPTSTTNTLGCSAGYSPVEQYVGITSFSPTADIYSLGATMLFCLSGAAPVVANHITRADIENAIPANVSEGMRRAILGAMAKNDADRTQSISDMLHQLGGELPSANGGGNGGDEPPVARRAAAPVSDTEVIGNVQASKGKAMKFVLAVIALLLIAAATFFGLRGCGEAESMPVRVADSLIAADTIPVVAPAVPQEVKTEPEKEEIKKTPAPEPKTKPYTKNEVKNERKENKENEAKPIAAAAPAPVAVKEPEPEPVKRQFDFASLSRLEHLALACVLDGKYYYFSRANWKKIPADVKSRFTKKGVVVIGNGERFILDLHDSGKEMTWDEAMSRYGNRLPTKSQAEAMVADYQAINAAIIAFGGDKDPAWFYWTSTERNSSSAWIVNMSAGYVFVNFIKTNTGRVRAVARVPSSAI